VLCMLLAFHLVPVVPSSPSVLRAAHGRIHSRARMLASRAHTAACSRRVNVYDSTPKGPHIEVLKPNNDWRRREAHTDDVTCAAQFGRNAVVTGQYDGGIVVWNLSTGRPRRIPSRERMEEDCPPTPMQEYIVFGVAPIDSRIARKDSHVAQLVVAATTGIYVWNTKAIRHGKVGHPPASIVSTERGEIETVPDTRPPSTSPRCCIFVE
jgi:hypothetical protein